MSDNRGAGVLSGWTPAAPGHPGRQAARVGLGTQAVEYSGWHRTGFTGAQSGCQLLWGDSRRWLAAGATAVRAVGVAAGGRDAEGGQPCSSCALSGEAMRAKETSWPEQQGRRRSAREGAAAGRDGRKLAFGSQSLQVNASGCGLAGGAASRVNKDTKG